MNGDISIQPVQPEHHAEWLRLRQAIYTSVDQEFHRQEMQLFFDDATKECFLALVQPSKACAMLEVSLRNTVDGCLTSPVGYIEGIYVEPDHRGAGLARRLIQLAEAWFRQQGCREMATDSELEDTAAQRFHEHNGFQETFRIVEYRKDL